MTSKTATDYIPQAFDAAGVRLLTNPAEAIEHARALAFEQGYNDGLNQAREAVETATADSTKRVRRALAALAEAVDAFDQRQSIALVDVEDAIVEGAFQIARAIVERELKTMEDPGAEALGRALALIPGRGEVVARLNPADVETLNMDRISTTARTVVVQPDASIELGGCIVEIDNTRIDTQFSSVFANVRTALGLSSEIGIGEAPVSMAAGSDQPSSRTTSQEAPLP